MKEKIIVDILCGVLALIMMLAVCELTVFATLGALAVENRINEILGLMLFGYARCVPLAIITVGLLVTACTVYGAYRGMHDLIDITK